MNFAARVLAFGSSLIRLPSDSAAIRAGHALKWTPDGSGLQNSGGWSPPQYYTPNPVAYAATYNLNPILMAGQSQTSLIGNVTDLNFVIDDAANPVPNGLVWFWNFKHVGGIWTVAFNAAVNNPNSVEIATEGTTCVEFRYNGTRVSAVSALRVD